jgi:hypothetical protein
MLRNCTADLHPYTAKPEHGLADVQSGQRERRVRGRDPAAASAARHAPREQRGEEDGEQQEGGHAPSLHAQAPAGKTPTGTCGEPCGSGLHAHPAPQQPDASQREQPERPHRHRAPPEGTDDGTGPPTTPSDTGAVHSTSSTVSS